ncbi:hypothetical protein GTU79_19490 [Sodalis ligni]|uniref:hypothetical protein n=1 Tax=Sodalis ligni TaxID=2697027 RepID=UPI00193F04BC|nr:hypothetical protein [Sodalis ligni]QWA09526.1 hypothetical protein GTU79_19490 [Sodalis ligni]
MAAFYTRMQALDTRLLTKYGKTMSLERAGTSVIDPVTGDATTSPPQSLPVIGVVQDFNRLEVDGTLILASDKKVTITAATAPLIGDSLQDGTTKWRIINISDKTPADVTLCYQLQVRR